MLGLLAQVGRAFKADKAQHRDHEAALDLVQAVARWVEGAEVCGGTPVLEDHPTQAQHDQNGDAFGEQHRGGGKPHIPASQGQAAQAPHQKSCEGRYRKSDPVGEGIEIKPEEHQAGQHHRAIAEKKGPGRQGSGLGSESGADITSNPIGLPGLMAKQHQGLADEGDGDQGQGVGDPGGLASHGEGLGNVDHRCEGEADGGHGLGGDGHGTQVALELGRGCRLGLGCAHLSDQKAGEAANRGSPQSARTRPVADGR